MRDDIDANRLTASPTTEERRGSHSSTGAVASAFDSYIATMDALLKATSKAASSALEGSNRDRLITPRPRRCTGTRDRSLICARPW